VIGHPEPQSGVTFVGAYAVCAQRGRILLVRIRDETPANGSWTLPGGGIRFGETPEEAVVRELAEETGLDGKVAAIVGTHSHVYPRSVAGAGRPLHHIGCLFRMEITGGELRDETDNTTDRAQWFTFAEAAELPLVPIATRAIQLASGTFRIRDF
jgi:8-oxo-dGTP diphosphatase